MRLSSATQTRGCFTHLSVTPGAPGVAPRQGAGPLSTVGYLQPRGVSGCPRGTRHLMAEWAAPRRPFVPGPVTFGN